jgi:hypothetical protein
MASPFEHEVPVRSKVSTFVAPGHNSVRKHKTSRTKENFRHTPASSSLPSTQNQCRVDEVVHSSLRTRDVDWALAHSGIKIANHMYLNAASYSSGLQQWLAPCSCS